MVMQKPALATLWRSETVSVCSGYCGAAMATLWTPPPRITKMCAFVEATGGGAMPEFDTLRWVQHWHFRKWIAVPTKMTALRENGISCPLGCTVCLKDPNILWVWFCGGWSVPQMLVDGVQTSTTNLTPKEGRDFARPRLVTKQFSVNLAWKLIGRTLFNWSK